uniref:Putative transporter MCH1 n=1 Tax=Noccaea caerulescens TaxID=107243 RepID=A0A1J3G7S9_NOCCA
MERINTKWVAAAASIWIQSFSGATYTFAIYSSILKSSQSYDQSTLDFVSVFKDIGGTLGIFSGFLYTAMTSKPDGRGGPWVVVFAGLVQWFLGFFFIWASVVGLIPPPPVALMCLFVFLSGHSLPFFNTASVVTAARNFPDYAGTAVGIMQGFLGLSGAILIQLYHAVSGGEGNPATFILLLAIVPTFVMFLAMPFVRVYETATTSNKKHLDGLSVISLIIAAYLMVIIVFQNVVGLSRSMQIFSFVLVLILLVSPLLVAVRALREEKQTLSSLDCPVLDTSALLDSPNSNIFPGGGDHVVIIEDSNILEAMSTVNFWLLFLAMLCGMGSGFATINNIRQIGESLRYSTVQLNSLVSLWSIWNFLGRFGAGYISDTFLHKYSWPRPVFMAITLGVMAIGHLIVASGLQGSLYAGSVLIGMAYGSQWSLMPTITSEIFGIRHMGTIYFTISIAGPVGSYLLSVKVIGYFYDKVASEDDNSCFGSQCFRTSFMIMASVALFGSFVASVLFFRTNMFYKRLVAKRSLK